MQKSKNRMKMFSMSIRTSVLTGFHKIATLGKYYEFDAKREQTNKQTHKQAMSSSVYIMRSPFCNRVQ